MNFFDNFVAMFRKVGVEKKCPYIRTSSNNVAGKGTYYLENQLICYCPIKVRSAFDYLFEVRKLFMGMLVGIIAPKFESSKLHVGCRQRDVQVNFIDNSFDLMGVNCFNEFVQNGK